MVREKKPTVVISGMSGRFPGANSVADYAASLYNKEELVGPVRGRFPTDGLFEELPDCIGRVEDFDKFDNKFFNIRPELAKIMDPQAKKMLEVTIEAILDAGLKLEDIKGPRTGAYYGHIYADLDRCLKASDLVERQNACSDPQIAFYRQLYQEWVSYCLDLSGPTYHYESACSSAMYALSDAFHAIQNDLLDTALIVTSNINLAPKIIIQYLRLGIMSRSGCCRFADANADGYIKSEAVCCIVLQRYDPGLGNVKRIYSNIVNTRCNSDGFKLEGITFPKTETQYRLIKETFEEVGLEPTQVNYVEAHGTGTQTGDVQELNCIDDIFNDEVHYSKRRSPLYVGSVKSNIGHAESSSGICSVIKCLFAFMYDAIPPVINYSTPNPKVPALLNGRINIVVDTLPLNTDLISVSSFGFGGSNTHVILQNGKSIRSVKDNFVSANKTLANCLDGYQLVNLAARSEQALMDSLAKLARQFRAYDINLNEVHLLNETVFREQVRLGFRHTGHLILNLRNPDEEPRTHVNVEPVNSSNLIDYHRNAHQSTNSNKLFFAVPGLGCQWTGMAIGLLEVPFFARRLKELCDMIQPNLEFDIYQFMLANQGAKEDTAFEIFNDSIFCLVAVAIYQMSFLDLLREIGLKPDGYFGHSFGELLCAYQDGIITDEQVLNATLVVCKLKHLYDECDKHDRPINNLLFERGQMAVVGLNWEDTLKEIEESKVHKVNAACNNSADCVTVSGAEDQVEEFLEHLTKKNIFNRKVASCGMAFHCEMVKDFYEYLLKGFKLIFKDPVKRGRKWISTSIDPLSEQEAVSWLANDEKSNCREKQTFAAYFANCILKPVLFREACEKMVTDLSKQQVNRVFVLEISPRSFLTSLMKSNTSKIPSVSYLPAFTLVKKENLFEKPNANLLVLLNVIGTLNENGLYSSSSKLYGGSLPGQVNGLVNGTYTNGHSKKTLSSASPIVTNRLPFSSLIGWDHLADFPVPAYPEFFNLSVDESKVDLNTVNYKVYLPNRMAKYRLPISFYVELLLQRFKKLNNSAQFTTVHIQDLIVYRLEELSEEDLAEVSTEVLEFYEHNALGQIYLFVVKNRNDQLILSGNLAVSNIKLKRLDQSDDSSASSLPADQFYAGLSCSDSKQQHLAKELLISSDRIQGKLRSGSNWNSQLDGLLQLYAHYHKRSIAAEIGEQTLQIHSVTIQPQESDEEDGSLGKESVWFDNLMNIGQSRQVEIKSIQFNSMPAGNLENEIKVDQNNNVEFRSKQTVINELSRAKLKAKWFKAGRKNLSFLGENEQTSVVGFLSESNKFSSKNCWPVKHLDLAGLLLLDGYLIAVDLLNRTRKLNPGLQCAFLNCGQNLDLLIAFSDLLTDRHCDTYVLLTDQSKADLVRACFSTRPNLHILSVVDPEKDDFDLELLRCTDGEGCQLVISQPNSRSEFSKSISSLSLGGQYVHLNNKQTSVNNLPLGMSLFLRNVDFQGLTLDERALDGVATESAQSILGSIDPSIIQQLNKRDQFELERLFEVNLIQN